MFATAPLQRVRGQLTVLQHEPYWPAPKVALSGAGYLLPPLDGQLIFGATAQPDDERSDSATATTSQNMHRLARLSPALAAAADAARSQPVDGRTGWRCVAADRLPLIGAVPAAWTAVAATARRSAAPCRARAGSVDAERARLARHHLGAARGTGAGRDRRRRAAAAGGRLCSMRSIRHAFVSRATRGAAAARPPAVPRRRQPEPTRPRPERLGRVVMLACSSALGPPSSPAGPSPVLRSAFSRVFLPSSSSWPVRVDASRTNNWVWPSAGLLGGSNER